MNDNEWAVEKVDEIAGVYMRSILLKQKGVSVPQHAHPYAHATLCASGSANVHMGMDFKGRMNAGDIMEVPKDISHTFTAQEDNTRLVCIHNTKSAEFIKAYGL